MVFLLSLASPVLSAVGGLPAVALDCAGRVELVEAAPVGALTLPTPDAHALIVHVGTLAIEAVSRALVTRHGVLHVDVGRALAREAVALLGKVAFVVSLSAFVPFWKELKKNQTDRHVYFDVQNSRVWPIF